MNDAQKIYVPCKHIFCFNIIILTGMYTVCVSVYVQVHLCCCVMSLYKEKRMYEETENERWDGVNVGKKPQRDNQSLYNTENRSLINAAESVKWIDLPPEHDAHYQPHLTGMGKWGGGREGGFGNPLSPCRFTSVLITPDSFQWHAVNIQREHCSTFTATGSFSLGSLLPFMLSHSFTHEGWMLD